MSAGILVFDRTFGSSHLVTTAVSQQGLGVDAPQADTGNLGTLELRQGGVPSGTALDLELQVIDGGQAADTGRGAAYAWRLEGDTSAEWRGWLSPQIPMALEELASTAPPSGAYPDGTVAWPHAIGLRSGRAVAVWMDRTYRGGLTSRRYELACATIDPDGSFTVRQAWEPTDQSASSQRLIAASLCVVPGPGGAERILAVVVCPRGADPEPVDEVSITVLVSDDEGETWAPAVEGAAGWTLAVGAVIGSVRVTYHRGHLVCLVVYALSGTGYVDQLVSADLGASWVVVDTVATSTTIDDPHPVSTAAGLLFVWIGAGGQLRYASLGTPYESGLASAAAGDLGVGGTTRLFQSLAVGVLEDGRLAVCGRLVSPRHNEVDLAVIDPASPATVQNDPRVLRWRTLLCTNDTGECLFPAGHPPALAFAGGRGLAIGGCISQVYGSGSPLYLLTLGGWSTPDWRAFGVGVETVAGGVPTPGQVGSAYLPISLPTAGWGSVVTQANTASDIKNARLTLEDGVGSAQYSILKTMVTGISTYDYIRRVAWGRVRIAAGPASPLDHTAGGSALIGLRFEEGDVVVELSLGTDEAKVVDRVAGTSLGTTTLTVDTEYEVLLMLTDDQAGDLVARGWVRGAGEEIWTEVGGGTLTVSGSALLGTSFRWGHLAASSTAGRETSWGAVYLSGHTDASGVYAGGRLLQAEDPATAIPLHLSGRPLTASPGYLYEGRTVLGRGGVALQGDTWALPARWSEGAWRTDPQLEPSPAAPWRTGDTLEQRLEWDLGQTFAFAGSSIGVALLGCNVGVVTLQFYTGSAWQTLLTCERRSASISWTRRGSLFYPASGTGELPWRDLDELEGCWIALSSGNVYKIRGNREGIWAAGAALPMQIQVDGNVGGEASTGTARIIFRDTVHVKHAVSGFGQRFALHIAAAQTVFGAAYEVGVAGVGPVVIFGADYDWGRTQITRAQVELLTDSRGGRRATTRGPSVRSVDFAWEALDERAARDGTGEVVSAYGAAVAAAMDPGQVEGLLRRCGGPAGLVAYLPALDLEVATEDLQGRTRVLYGRVTSPVTRRTILGDELTDEVISLDAITIEEEV